LRHGLVIERIGEPVACRRSADIGSQLQIQQQVPAGLAFPGMNADERFYAQFADKNNVHDGAPSDELSL
jgi:hypothetical protein